MYMKAIQVTFDAELLKRLDADDEVKKVGRSEVLRRAAADYLRRKRSARIAEAYRRGYAKDGGLGEDWSGWQNEGVWPDE
jgi:metal-responsive CopG/Arc/MetJ family transcriptional regulator